MKYFIYISIAICVIAGCKKDSQDNVPNTALDVYLYTNNPSFINVSTIGGWVYLTGGVRGILVFRKSNTEFMTYDRNCTYHSSDACAIVTVDANNITATDSCCHSSFSLYDGSVYHGPAAAPLKAYSNTFDGNVLHIYN